MVPHRLGLALAVLLATAATSCSAPTGPTCNGSTCLGCCANDGTCRPGTSNDACGSGGLSCDLCSIGQSCTLGACGLSGVGGGGGGDDGGAGGGGTGGGGGGATGGGTGGGATGGGAGGGMTGGGAGGGMTGGGTGGGSADGGAPGNCSGTLIDCGGTCRDLAADFNHCGRCGNACGPGLVCNAGTCAALPTDCVTGGGCAPGYYCDPQTRACRAGCRLSADCPMGATCNTNNVCVCPTGQHPCGQVCVSDTSPTSCGARCTSCPGTANGAATCSNQTCGLSCNVGHLLCDSTCAPCTTPANATATCSGATCAFTCTSGFHQCSGQCVPNGDVATCGTRCTPCPAAPANAVATCDGTNCGYRCNPGFVACASGCCAVQGLNLGANHGCLVTSEGGAKCWGNGGSGRLGTGNTSDRSRPTDVSGLSANVLQVSAGALHGCALMGDGGVKCWGANASYQLATGGGSTANQTTPVNVALTTAASFLGSMRNDHTCVVTSTGGLRCWGDNTFGQLGAGNTSLFQSPTPVANITSGATWVSAGFAHTCAVASTNVYCWGSGSAGQLGLGNGNNRSTPGLVPGVTASMVAAGSSHTCAVTMAGGLKCWGQNSEYQLGDPSTTVGSASPLDVAGLTSGVAFVCGGWRHTCVVTTAGAVKCFGRNAEGQLGNGTTSATSASPVDVTGLTSGAAKVFCGDTHSCALLTNGSVMCWGANGAGRLGDGTTTPRLTPVFLSGSP